MNLINAYYTKILIKQDKKLFINQIKEIIFKYFSYSMNDKNMKIIKQEIEDVYNTSKYFFKVDNITLKGLCLHDENVGFKFTYDDYDKMKCEFINKANNCYDKIKCKM